jgi:hypothetical protein
VEVRAGLQLALVSLRQEQSPFFRFAVQALETSSLSMIGSVFKRELCLNQSTRLFLSGWLFFSYQVSEPLQHIVSESPEKHHVIVFGHLPRQAHSDQCSKCIPHPALLWEFHSTIVLRQLARPEGPLQVAGDLDY